MLDVHFLQDRGAIICYCHIAIRTHQNFVHACVCACEREREREGDKHIITKKYVTTRAVLYGMHVCMTVSGHAPLGPRDDLSILATVRAARMLAFEASFPAQTHTRISTDNGQQNTQQSRPIIKFSHANKQKIIRCCAMRNFRSHLSLLSLSSFASFTISFHFTYTHKFTHKTHTHTHTKRPTKKNPKKNEHRHHAQPHQTRTKKQSNSTHKHTAIQQYQ